MPVPDAHADEPTVQVDELMFTHWREAYHNAARWKAIADKLREQLEDQIGNAYAGMIGDQKVILFRPSNKWAGQEIVKQYPDLAQHFMRTQVTEVFDVEAFRASHPDIAEKFRVRSFRAVEEK